ncbi:unnamed protein product, partial [Ectocarpus sp. 12 AP-2014]
MRYVLPFYCPSGIASSRERTPTWPQAATCVLLMLSANCTLTHTIHNDDTRTRKRTNTKDSPPSSFTHRLHERVCHPCRFEEGFRCSVQAEGTVHGRHHVE